MTTQRQQTSKPRGVCTYFRSRRGCRNGDMCKFLHGDGETLSPYDKSKVCKFYAAGFCKHGDKCWFRHVNGTSAEASAEVRVSATQTIASEVEGEVNDILCSICQEKPVTFGLLEDCSHVFCLECIRGWRDPTGKSQDLVESGNTKRCPYCRASSNFVTPSSIFYPSGEPTKATIITNYKASMARIPCKYFETSTPGSRYCPFGRDCFYQHKEVDGSMYVFDRGADYYLTRRRRRSRSRNVSFSDLLSNIRSTRTQTDVLQLLEELRSRFNLPAHEDADDDSHHEDSQLSNLLEDVLMNLGEALIDTFSASSDDEHAEEDQSSSRPSILATPGESTTISALPLTRAFMENNIPSDHVDSDAGVNESENEDERSEGPSARTFRPQSHSRTHSLPNLANAWTDELLSVSDTRANVGEEISRPSVNNCSDVVEQASAESFTLDQRRQIIVPIESTSDSGMEGTNLLGLNESSLQQTASNSPLVPERELNEAHPLRNTATPRRVDDSQSQDRETRTKPDVHNEPAPRRIKLSGGAVPCSGRRNGGQSFVTDGRGRVVATDDWTYADGASMAFWPPAMSAAAPPPASTGETSARLPEEPGALDDLD